MTRRENPMAVVVLAMALSAAAPMMVWAGEHGGQEHGGTPVAAKAQGGAAPAAVDEAAVLREAAAALRAGQARPDLAAQLEKLAKAHQ